MSTPTTDDRSDPMTHPAAVVRSTIPCADCRTPTYAGKPCPNPDCEPPSCPGCGHRPWHDRAICPDCGTAA